MPGSNQHSKEGEREKERVGKRERREGNGEGEIAFGGCLRAAKPTANIVEAVVFIPSQNSRDKEREKERERGGRKEKEQEIRPPETARGLLSPLLLLCKQWAFVRLK